MVHFDQRSRGFALRGLLGAAPVQRRTQVWAPRAEPLDQGREGACVGFALAGELAAQPWTHTVDNAFARSLYEHARTEDRAMGNRWAAGASLLAGVKACRRLGLISEYRWSFGIDDVIDALIGHGPVVLGVNWYEGMYATGSNGLLEVSGRKVGGHAILAFGYMVHHPVIGGDVVLLHNSWGRRWGFKGVGYMKPAALASLLDDRGEACSVTDVPVAAPAGG